MADIETRNPVESTPLTNSASDIDTEEHRIVYAASQYSGPLPEAAQLQKYEDILPGAADRILRMAEEQSAHRRALESKVVTADSRNSLIGIISALTICIGVIIASCFIVSKGYSLQGVILIGTSLAAVVSAFIYGARSNRKPPNKNK